MRDAYINPNISGSRRDALAKYILDSSISGLGNSPTLTMSDFDFSRNSSGNYQATIGYTDTRVTIQAFADKIYVDIRDYFNKDTVFFPTKRGITLTKTEWQQLCAQADQTGNSVVQIIEELPNDKQPMLPIDITVTDELKQSIRLFNWSNSFGPHRSTRIAISKTKSGETLPSCARSS